MRHNIQSESRYIMSILSNLSVCREDLEDYMHDVDDIYQHVHSCSVMP